LKNMAEYNQETYSWWVRAIVAILRCWMWLYNLVSYIPFLILINPRARVEVSKRTKAKPLIPNDPTSPYRRTSNFDKLHSGQFAGVDTISKMWKRSADIYRHNSCLGTREVLNVEMELQPNGKKYEKLVLGEYRWQTYETVSRRVNNIGSGLLHVGHRTGKNLVIFAETQCNWLMTALACFTYKIPIVTVYATLGENAIAHAINSTEAETIVTSQDLIPKIKRILSRCKTLKRLIYFTPRYSLPKQLTPEEIIENFDTFDLEEIEDFGDEHYAMPTVEPEPDDIAMIMFTSGTTEAPKGVLLSHKNLVAASSSQFEIIPNPDPNRDVYVGYLPLAHVLEVDAEICCIANGIRIGYSTPLTLTDNSSMIKANTRGDCSVLNPTVIAVVPAIMDRIYKTVRTRIQHSSQLGRALFEYVYEVKRNRIEDGYSTPFLNRMIFWNIRNVLGERIRLILCGGAPLSQDTQQFMRICFCCPVSQGYGLTETAGGATLTDADDLSTGRVGPPLSCSDIMLRDWVEGGYTVNNEPYPQGEVLIAGDNVAQGYLNNPQKTKEDFVEIDGRTWFCSGDIGEFHPDGALCIIDRKKDLVKLQHGEYVSLSKIETALMTCPLVEFVCIVCNPLYSFVIALIVPNKKNLEKFVSEYCCSDLNARTDVCFEIDSFWSSRQSSAIRSTFLYSILSANEVCPKRKIELSNVLGVDDLTYEQQCEDKSVINAFKQEIQNHAKQLVLCGLEVGRGEFDSLRRSSLFVYLFVWFFYFCLVFFDIPYGKGEENFLNNFLIEQLLLLLLLLMMMMIKKPAFFAERLEKFEIPSVIYLCKENWTSQMGLLTEAMKLKRKAIADYYSEQIEAVYASALKI
ncbi:Long-chain-fatty-acid--CoA ligase 4, partial [Trichinella nelsoni]